MISRLKIYLPAAWDLVDSFLYDFWRYCRYSQTLGRFRSRDTSRAFLMMSAHALEKGLALETPRPGFGKQKCKELLQDVSKFQEKFGPDAVCSYSVEVVGRVLDYHRLTGHEDPGITSAFEQLNSQMLHPSVGLDTSGGLRTVRRKDVASSLPPVAYDFFATRHSVRQFARSSISESAIRDAVRIAQRSPSVCNRQSSRIFYTTDTLVIKEVVAYQRGADGFGENASALFVITSELTAFKGPGERYQSFIDGGLFAMSFALGVHALGYGTCFLNWSKIAREDRRLREVFSIPASQVIVTLLVAGCLREEFAVAASPRLPIEEILATLQKQA